VSVETPGVVAAPERGAVAALVGHQILNIVPGGALRKLDEVDGIPTHIRDATSIPKEQAKRCNVSVSHSQPIEIAPHRSEKREGALRRREGEELDRASRL
jgi:hypothetical protein